MCAYQLHGVTFSQREPSAAYSVTLLAILQMPTKWSRPWTVVKFNATDSELWEISENLDRAELSVLDRSKLIDRWRVLKQEKKVAQVGPLSRLPNDLATSPAAPTGQGASRRLTEMSGRHSPVRKGGHRARADVGLRHLYPRGEWGSCARLSPLW